METRGICFPLFCSLKCKVRAPAWLACGAGPSLGGRLLTSRHVLPWQKGCGISLKHLIRARIPLMRFPPSWSVQLPKAPTLTLSPWTLAFQHVSPGGTHTCTPWRGEKLNHRDLCPTLQGWVVSEEGRASQNQFCC